MVLALRNPLILPLTRTCQTRPIRQQLLLAVRSRRHRVRLSELERELHSAGFTFARQRGSHMVFRDAAGHVLTVTRRAAYNRWQLAHIRRSLGGIAQLRTVRGEEEGA